MTKQTTNTTYLFTLSAAFEYYDFIIYVLMASYLGLLFFPSDDLLVGQVKAFSVFALVYVVRPLGGLILGMLGDVRGRKAIFIKSNIILSLATIGVSILPSYAQIGVAATILLIILRIVQAIAFAGELPGAMVLIQDSSKQPSKNFSFVISGASIGAIMASGSLYLLETFFSKEQILEYAWRLPFIFGAVLCLIGVAMRSKLPEMAYDKAKDSMSILSSALPQMKNIVSIIMIVSVPAYLIIMNMFFPSFMAKFYGYLPKDLYLAISLSLLFAAVYAPVFAYLTAKMDKLNLLRMILFAGMFLGLIINFLFLRGSFINLIVGLFIYQAIISSLMVIIFPLMSEVFPANARYTLIAFSYNIAYLLMSFAPMLVTKVSAIFEGPFSLWLGLIILSLFALTNMNRLAQED